MQVYKPYSATQKLAQQFLFSSFLPGCLLRRRRRHLVTADRCLFRALLLLQVEQSPQLGVRSSRKGDDCLNCRRKKPQEFSSRSSRISKGPPKSPPPPTKKSVKPPESKRNVDHSRNSALRELKSKNVYKLDKYVVNSKEVVGRRPLLCL